MVPVSQRFLAALRDVHGMDVAAYVYEPGDDSNPIEVQVSGGNVDANANARVLRQASLDVTYAREDTDMTALLQRLPFGGYCHIERGVRYADGDVERVRLGHFRVESVVLAELQGTATLTLADRFAQVQDEPLPAPWTPDGMHPTDAIVQLVHEVFGPRIQYHVLTDPSSEPVMAGTTYDQLRTEAISDMAQAVGAEVLFDVWGDLVVRPRYNPHDAVWTVDAGARGVLTKGEVQLDRSSVRNGVSVRGQPDTEQPPIYGLATYDEPTSPIRWGGPFGRVVMIAESTAVTTQEQADAMARSLLNLRLALSRTLNLESVPNPALEPEDVVAVVFPDGHVEQQAIKETHVGLATDAALGLVCVDKYAADFTPEALTLRHGADAARELELAVVA